MRKHEGFDIVEINRFCREIPGRLNRRRGNGLRQGAVRYAQPVEHAHSTIGQIPAMAQEAARPDRKAWDQFGPFLPGQLRAVQCRAGNRGVCFAKPAHQFRIAEAPAVFTDDGCAFGSGNHFRQRDQAQIGGRFQGGVAGLRPFAKQVEQLAELCLCRARTGGAVAQHSSKAVVKMHRYSGDRQ